MSVGRREGLVSVVQRDMRTTEVLRRREVVRAGEYLETPIFCAPERIVTATLMVRRCCEATEDGKVRTICSK